MVALPPVGWQGLGPEGVAAEPSPGSWTAWSGPTRTTASPADASGTPGFPVVAAGVALRE